MDLETLFDSLRDVINTDADLAAVPYLTQVARTAVDKGEASTFNDDLQKALREPGVALSAIAADGDLVSPGAPILDLMNTVVLSIVESPRKNTTGMTAYQYMRRVLRVVHFQRSQSRGARLEIKLAQGQAYALGPLDKGLVTYFVTLNIRTTEDLGALNPA